eukprot:CAMPEP_0185026656 /NCGR_PEP_ID=MMETSP1103-20130426/10988_1 /TAXON_ID=36769 /ORGANISM="Paraphysomonas bandaiensis, Strain Caron Lab Isolate" /LENGTH=460 /DNA_ID=CAMNT_0027560309 /DNA_START=209 /DNA_END=1591 /DNA_ORIENTATION=+
MATDGQILLYHTEEHLNHLGELFNRAEESHTKQRIDGDTEVMHNTRNAVYRATGSVIAAVDHTFLPITDPLSIRTAFCCVRPPGHHAEQNRAMGFCFVNGAAVAAQHARTCHGIDRVAVLDFDVHHGNGTEQGFRADSSGCLFYGSTQEMGNYPGTGDQPPLAPVSNEEMDVMRDRLGEKNFELLWGKEGSLEVAEDAEDRRVVNREIIGGRGSREEFRRRWREVIYEMVRFNPQLVIISAGFDAHIRDPLGGMQLEEEDYKWATELVMDACKLCAQQQGSAVPCISVLEGGYDLLAISRSAAVHVKALFEKALEHTESEALCKALEHTESEANNDDAQVEEQDESHIEDETSVGCNNIEEKSNESIADVWEDDKDKVDGVLSLDDVLASLDVSINSLMLSALMSNTTTAGLADSVSGDDVNCKPSLGSTDSSDALVPGEVQVSEPLVNNAVDEDERGGL